MWKLYKQVLQTKCIISKSLCKNLLPKHIFTYSHRMASSSKEDIVELDAGGVLSQQFDYFLVLDFEATCQKDQRIVPQEIIEFPVLKINAQTLQTESVFHQYVQPKVHPQLSTFCTELTGIIQEMVDGQPYIEEVLENFHTWMNDNDLLNPEKKFIFVTCGDWDLKTMLPSQIRYFGLQNIYRPYFWKWINIKKPFVKVMNEYPKGMMQMLQMLDIPHEGRHHSGIDDCKNIGKILTGLLHRGAVLKQTGKL